MDNDAGEIELDDFNPWTAEGAELLLAAAEVLAVAVRAHASRIAGCSGRDHMPELMAATDELVPAVVAYADAQFDFTGNGFPFGQVEPLDWDEHDEDEDEARPSSGVTVLQRQDYAITNEAAVLAAGRVAYLKAWPEGSAADAEEDVTHIGRALYQIGHSAGWSELRNTAGLEPTGGVVIVNGQDAPLNGEPEQWPEDLFDVDGPMLYRQEDVWT